MQVVLTGDLTRVDAVAVAAATDCGVIGDTLTTGCAEFVAPGCDCVV